MAIISWTEDTGQIVAVRFDAIQVVEHGLEAEITTHPVEDGADIADNIRPGRPHVTVTGIVSNTPLFSDSSIVTRNGVAPPAGVYRPVQLPKSPVQPRVPVFLGATDVAVGLLQGNTAPTAFDGLVFDNLESRVREITEVLTEALNEKRLVSVSDEAADYDNMGIEGRIVTRTAEGGKAAVVILNMTQLEIVSTSLVDAPIPAELRGQALTTGGSAAASSSKNEESKKTEAKSWAASLYDAARSGL